MKKEIKEGLGAMYQATTRNNNNPFLVKVLEIKNKTATVCTYNQPRIEFKCKLSSLYPV